MLADPMETAAAHLGFTTRSKRLKMEAGNNQRHYDATGCGRKTLELQGVIDVLKEYDDYEGGINCSICGKNQFLTHIHTQRKKNSYISLKCFIRLISLFFFVLLITN